MSKISKEDKGNNDNKDTKDKKDQARKKDESKSKKILLFGILAIIIIIIDIIIYSKFIYNERSNYKDNYSISNSSYQSGQTTEIKQSFKANRNNMNAISIGFDKSFRTYNNDAINIKIIDKTNDQVIGEYNDIYNTIVQNEKDYKFEFEKQPESLDKEYEIVISYANGSETNPLLYNTQNTYDNGAMTVNDKQQGGDMAFSVYYYNRYANAIFILGMIGISLVSLILIALIAFGKLQSNKIFLIAVIVIGLIYVFVIPIYRGHDEHAHFFRAYEISQGVLNTKIIEGESLTEIPAAMFDTLHEDYNSSERWINDTYYDDVIRSKSVKLDNENKIYVGGEYMAVYSPIPYIPQAITIRIVSLFTKNLLVIFYLTRIVNLAVSIALIMLSIKLIPVGKHIIKFIALMPSTFSLIASCSPDALTITLCILFFAYLLKLIKDDSLINKKQIGIISAIGVLMGLCKIVYIPFVLLLLAIPKKKFKNRKDRILLMLLGIGLPIIANMIWLSIAGKHLELIDNNKSDVQKHNILTNPLDYIRICFYTLYFQTNIYFQQMFGGIMEHVGMVNVGYINVFTYIVLFVMMILFNKESKIELETKFKVMLSLILFIICCLIFTSLYMQWSSLKYYYINGIQGRYFIELLLPLSILLSQHSLIQKEGKIDINKIILYSGIILNAVASLSSVVTYI